MQPRNNYYSISMSILTSWVTGASTSITLQQFLTCSRLSTSSSQQSMSLHVSLTNPQTASVHKICIPNKTMVYQTQSKPSDAGQICAQLESSQGQIFQGLSRKKEYGNNKCN